ncbi:anti-sigma factor family protein [Paenibacillus riograndensis]|uniref:Anti-sigma-W factor RsiW n=1 Tax=Paenibacillus riograndensis SBR5 TaxID=1073571 RepID=A0A0E4H8M3_9BACL|nr:zf-HC2 domain-containing protein [Paenibacillus riograndensis]CQR54652.1 putative membrane protein [Paenibacillus riograndensis SBR5]
MHPDEQLSAYLDGELAQEEQLQIESHLDNCPSCQSLLLELMELKQMFTAAMNELAEPAELETRIMQAVAKESAKQSLGKLWLWVLLFSALVFVLIILKASSIIIPLIKSLWVVGRALLYAASHAVADIPVFSGIVVILSLIVLLVSVLFIRKVLRSAAI